MVGVTSYGAYVPRWRLSRGAIAEGARGEKSICNFDEDSVTMAVAAAMDCLRGVDREAVDGLLFASTTSPYGEKECAAIAATAADLPRNIVTADFTNSLKAGATAIKFASDAVKAGTARQIMVTATDRRQGEAMTPLDQGLGDGAAALLIGDTNVIASLEASYLLSDTIMDIWRDSDDTFLRNAHERFVDQKGYMDVISEAVAGLLKESGFAPNDFAKIALYAPNARRAREVATRLGFDVKLQLQDTMSDVMGNTGVPHSLMTFIAALENARPGDLILFASYGDGAAAFAFRVTEEIDKVRGNPERRGMKKYLESKSVINDFKTYWLWRGLLRPNTKAGFLPHHFWKISPTALWRERERILRFHAYRCKVCGTVQYPPQRVCAKCDTRDQYEPVRLSDRKGTIFTYSMDYLSSPVDVPIVVPIVTTIGDGKILCYLTDHLVEELKPGLEVEWSLRNFMVREGIQNYFWKAMPVRA